MTFIDKMISCGLGHTIGLLCLLAAQGITQVPVPLPAEILSSPPLVTASSWMIIDGQTGTVVASENAHVKCPIADITMIMTALVVFDCVKAKPQIFDEIATVSKIAVGARGGRRAGLVLGEKMSVRGLLHGMLLASGTDAATCLAEYFDKRCPALRPTAMPIGKGMPRMLHRKRFVAQMNRMAKQLGLKDTRFLMPHGDSTHRQGATSTVADLVRLGRHAMQKPRLAKILGTRRYVARSVTKNGQAKEQLWKNSNALLAFAEYDGLKNGTSEAAGRCLLASGKRQGEHLIVAVLGCGRNPSRYNDTRNLFRWAWRQRTAK